MTTSILVCYVRGALHVDRWRAHPPLILSFSFPAKLAPHGDIHDEEEEDLEDSFRGNTPAGSYTAIDIVSVPGTERSGDTDPVWDSNESLPPPLSSVAISDKRRRSFLCVCSRFARVRYGHGSGVWEVNAGCV